MPAVGLNGFIAMGLPYLDFRMNTTHEYVPMYTKIYQSIPMYTKVYESVRMYTGRVKQMTQITGAARLFFLGGGVRLRESVDPVNQSVRANWLL